MNTMTLWRTHLITYIGLLVELEVLLKSKPVLVKGRLLSIGVTAIKVATTNGEKEYELANILELVEEKPLPSLDLDMSSERVSEHSLMSSERQDYDPEEFQSGANALLDLALKNGGGKRVNELE